jgi:hypothetical protein
LKVVEGKVQPNIFRSGNQKINQRKVRDWIRQTFNGDVGLRGVQSRDVLLVEEVGLVGL